MQFHIMKNLYLLHIYDRAAIEKNKKRINIYVVLVLESCSLYLVLYPGIIFSGDSIINGGNDFRRFSRSTALGRRQVLRRVCGVLFNQFKQKNCLILQGFFPHFGFFHRIRWATPLIIVPILGR